MSPSIFLSYRSSDDAYAAALLDVMLSQRFGDENVFRASRSIPPGADYSTELLNGVRNCDVALVVAGPGWSEASDRDGHRRLDEDDDWVRIEITECLKRDIPVIPVLLSGAKRMSEVDLPPEIQKLAKCQYLRFDYRNIESDFSRLASAVAAHVPHITERDSEQAHVLQTLGALSDAVLRLGERMSDVEAEHSICPRD